MNEITNFVNENFGKVRSVQIDGNPWFVVSDICDIFCVTNRSRVMQAIPEDEKGGTQMTTPGGIQTVSIVNEPGLYSMLFALRPRKARYVSEEYVKSRTQQLDAFKRWITHEVIPTIRKHGIYATPSAAEKILSDPDYGIKLLEAIKAERTEKERLAQKVQEMLPKANYCDVVLSSEDLIPTTVIAKDYGFTAKKFNRMLHDLGVQFKKGRYWHLYDKYANEGYAQSKTYVYPGKKKDHVVKVDTQWTQPGRMFIYDLLKGIGILPIVEREAV